MNSFVLISRPSCAGLALLFVLSVPAVSQDRNSPSSTSPLNAPTTNQSRANPSFDCRAARSSIGFKAILNSFFPRYIRILRSPKYADAIEEVRIEGHTSALWKNLAPELAYYENMRLSQERARSVLIHVFGIPAIRDDLRWILTRVTANGLSSAKRLLLPDGSEDLVGSQRVEFRVRTTAEDQLSKILGALSK
jgi:outer membrane protein OmpA-like peptidoglycan-associated protein